MCVCVCVCVCVHIRPCVRPCVRPACPGGAGSVCSNHGDCDDGHLGNGTCSCHDGFGGVACELCGDGHYGPACQGTVSHRSAVRGPVTAADPHLHTGHLADACIQSDLQEVHLSEERETIIYRCRYSKEVHRTKCQALTTGN